MPLTSIDTNLLLYSINADCPEFAAARGFVSDLADSTDVVIAEYVLVELYLLLRNPAVVREPLPAAEAVAVCQAFRRNPQWQLVEAAHVMDEVWNHASKVGFARRCIVDARLALTLRRHGVTDFATRNTAHFQGYGFDRVWDPIARREADGS